MSSISSFVDYSALRFNQASIIILLAVAFLLDLAWLVAFVALVMWLGTLVPSISLFKRLYRHVFQPLKLIRPAPRPDDPRPHLFAQGVGALFLTGASLALFANSSVVGWLLVGIVVALAAINLFFGFCLGCFVYYQLARRGVKANLPWWQVTQGA